MSDRSLADLIRKTAVSIAVDAVSSVQDTKRVLDAIEAADADSGARRRRRRPRPPSLLKINSFVGDAAGFGLTQLNDLLVLKARYWGDVVSWITEELIPGRVVNLPEPEKVSLPARPGGTVEHRFVVENKRSCPATLTFACPVLRTDEGAEVPEVPHEITPTTLELQPYEPFVVSVALTLTHGECGEPLSPGRYVGRVDASIGGSVVHRLLMDIQVQPPTASEDVDQ